MPRRLYVDESKEKGYLLVAATIPAESAQHSLREKLQDLRLRGQRSLHMKKENDRRKKKIIDILSDFKVDALVYDAKKNYRTEKDSRYHCLQQMLREIATFPTSKITFDRDESLVSRDRQQLIEFNRSQPGENKLEYEHVSRNDEVLLIAPDAIAWCWARGGEWRQRVRGLVRYQEV